MAKKTPVTLIRTPGGPDIVVDLEARRPYVQVGAWAMDPDQARILAENITKAADLAEQGKRS